jgi:anti-sigma-K factor RskA
LAAALGWGQVQQQRLQGDVGQLRQQLVGQAEAAQQARAELAQVHRVGQVAVLNDERAGAALLVTFDPQRQQLQVKRVGTYQEANEKSLQLWTIAPGQAPKSLGVLGREAREQLAAAQGDVTEQRVLAVSLEPLGGVPSERGPTGPVLFKGVVLGT